MFAALLAVFLQAFVIQTHIHTIAIAPPALSSTQLAGSDASAQLTATSEHLIACAICEALAAAGAATLPKATSITAAVQPNTGAALALALAPRVHSHSWQSRAPPSFL